LDNRAGGRDDCRSLGLLWGTLCILKLIGCEEAESLWEEEKEKKDVVFALGGI